MRQPIGEAIAAIAAPRPLVGNRLGSVVTAVALAVGAVTSVTACASGNTQSSGPKIEVIDEAASFAEACKAVTPNVETTYGATSFSLSQLRRARVLDTKVQSAICEQAFLNVQNYQDALEGNEKGKSVSSRQLQGGIAEFTVSGKDGIESIIDLGMTATGVADIGDVQSITIFEPKAPEHDGGERVAAETLSRQLNGFWGATLDTPNGLVTYGQAATPGNFNSFAQNANAVLRLIQTV